MTSDDRSPEAIERNIERERADLTDTLETLQSKFSVESIARQVSDQFSKHGGDIGQSITDAVKRNPIGLALTGIGLAWLMLGDKSPSRPAYDMGGSDHDRSREDQTGVRDWNAGMDNSAEQRGLQSTRPSYRPYGAQTSWNSARRMPSWAGGDQGQTEDARSSLMESAGDMAQSVSSTVASTGEAVANAGANVMGKAADLGHSAVDSLKGMASASADKIGAMADRVMEGTEGLSAEARERVVAARRRAMEFRTSAIDYGRQGGAKAMDLFEEQPLIAGAIAMAFGAAIGAALPKSQIENDYMGEQRDRLFHEAEQIFHDEKAKLTSVVKAAGDEVKTIAQEVKDNAAGAVPSGSVAQAIADKARSSMDRVVEATGAEAKRQNLGDLST